MLTPLYVSPWFSGLFCFNLTIPLLGIIWILLGHCINSLVKLTIMICIIYYTQSNSLLLVWPHLYCFPLFHVIINYLPHKFHIIILWNFFQLLSIHTHVWVKRRIKCGWDLIASGWLNFIGSIFLQQGEWWHLLCSTNGIFVWSNLGNFSRVFLHLLFVRSHTDSDICAIHNVTIQWVLSTFAWWCFPYYTFSNDFSNAVSIHGTIIYFSTCINVIPIPIFPWINIYFDLFRLIFMIYYAACCFQLSKMRCLN